MVRPTLSSNWQRVTFQIVVESTAHEPTWSIEISQVLNGKQNGSNLNRDSKVVEHESNTSVMLLGTSVECCTLNGKSLVAKSVTSLHFDPSNVGTWNSVNQKGPNSSNPQSYLRVLPNQSYTNGIIWGFFFSNWVWYEKYIEVLDSLSDDGFWSWCPWEFKTSNQI